LIYRQQFTFINIKSLPVAFFFKYLFFEFLNNPAAPLSADFYNKSSSPYSSLSFPPKYYLLTIEGVLDSPKSQLIFN